MDETISPEVFKAQRQRELEQMAAYRSLKLQEYIKWSSMSDAQRQERLEQYRAEEQAARTLVARQAEEYAKFFSSPQPVIRKTPFVKPLPPKKKGIFQRFIAWIQNAF